MNPSFDSHAEPYKKLVDSRIFELIDKNKPELLYEPIRYALQSGGKRLRPVLLLWACEAVGGDITKALDAAAAIEIVHNFTLVHDDIMDRDELRRGRETVYKHWNENVAILAGDAMLVKAYEALNAVLKLDMYPIFDEFSRAILHICEGQIMDMDFETRNDVSLDEYFWMIDKKTAQLFSLACGLGAELGSDNDEHIVMMQQYGMSIGHAFQIQDDLLDVMADENVFGKDVGSDLYKDKKTFLIIHARETASGEQAKQLRDKLHLLKERQTDVSDILALLKEIGTIDAAKNEIRKALNTAEKSLGRLPKSQARHYLKELIKTIEHRTF